MKHNLPVNDRQTEIPIGVTLVSKTDLKGIITYANEAFVEASGYTLQELLGHSHNIVRHPDMPAAAFADMWRNLHSGRPWQGLVKNRCKDGGYYWVDACVVPIQRQDHIIGYMSVRKRALPADIAAAQTLYARVATSTHLPPPQRLPAWLGIRTGMRAGSLFVACLMLAGGVLGIGGLKLADAAFTRLYHTQLTPLSIVGQVESRLSDSRSIMLEMRLAREEGGQDRLLTSLDQHMSQLQANRDEMQSLLAQLTRHTDATAHGNAALNAALDRYTADGLHPVQDAAARHDMPLVDQLIRQRVLPLEQDASAIARTLRESLVTAAHTEYTNTLERNARIRHTAMVGILLGLLLVGLVGRMFIRGIVDPLNTAIQRLNRIAQGDLQGPIDLSGSGETGQLNHAAAVMQLHLKVMIDEIALAARRIHHHCAALNIALYEVTEHSEEQHERVHAAIRALDTAMTETNDLSERAELLLQRVISPAEGADDGALEDAARELATATRLAAFGAEEVASTMHQVAELIVENRGEAQRAWRASEELKRTAGELNHLVDYFETPTVSTRSGSIV